MYDPRMNHGLLVVSSAYVIKISRLIPEKRCNSPCPNQENRARLPYMGGFFLFPLKTNPNTPTVISLLPVGFSRYPTLRTKVNIKPPPSKNCAMSSTSQKSLWSETVTVQTNMEVPRRQPMGLFQSLGASMESLRVQLFKHKQTLAYIFAEPAT